MTTKFLAGGSVEKIEDKFWRHKQQYFSWFLRGKNVKQNLRNLQVTSELRFGNPFISGNP